MTTVALPHAPSAPVILRRAALGLAMLCVVAGSQWGMLMLAALYVRAGRIEDTASPEFFAGIAAIALAGLVLRLRGAGGTRDYVLRWLFCFLAYASVAELLRPELRLNNVTTFISIGAYYLIGTAIGHEIARRETRLPMLPALLGIYTIWYLTMAVFFARGDLGFYGVLPDSDLTRLEFRQGYTATELPIYVGFQLPVLLNVIATERGAGLRIWALLLVACAISLIVATASSAAMAAISLVLLVFLVAKVGLSLRSIVQSLGILIAGIALAFAVSGGLVASVEGKLLNFSVGEGVRALIYAELVSDIVEQPLGIGKGRFVETNNFSWLGEGVFPHQNLLGIGAELGVPALLLFLGFIITAIVVLGRALSRQNATPLTLRMLAATVLAMFLYQQFRGLFQDTWVIRETYLWLGLGVGTLTAHTAAAAPLVRSNDSRR
jgi:hypothetical protein